MARSTLLNCCFSGTVSFASNPFGLPLPARRRRSLASTERINAFTRCPTLHSRLPAAPFAPLPLWRLFRVSPYQAIRIKAPPKFCTGKLTRTSRPFTRRSPTPPTLLSLRYRHRIITSSPLRFVRFGCSRNLLEPPVECHYPHLRSILLWLAYRPYQRYLYKVLSER